LRHGLEYPTNLRGLYELTSRGNRLAYNGRELLDGVNYHVTEVKTNPALGADEFRPP
jgi:hypothetical protein